MKKLLLVGCILLTGAVAFASDVEANFADLEATFQVLQAEEKALYEARKQEALDAQEKLNQQRKMYSEVAAKEKVLGANSKSKLNGEQYKELAARYGEIKKELEAEMKANEKVIADFNALSK
ncbi:MAG: adhesion protein FadA [Fusobacteriaceae bacterium]|jgi:hypothetical protein|nr:adhesion protein FadA [Fusobacteriaceae bacterium]